MNLRPALALPPALLAGALGGIVGFMAMVALIPPLMETTGPARWLADRLFWPLASVTVMAVAALGFGAVQALLTGGRLRLARALAAAVVAAGAAAAILAGYSAAGQSLPSVPLVAAGCGAAVALAAHRWVVSP